MAKYERHEPLIADSTMIRSAKECPRKYFLQFVVAKIPNQEQIIFSWGKAYHKFREVLEITQDVMEGVRAGLAVWEKGQGSDPAVGSKFEFMTKARLLKSFNVAAEHWENEKTSKRIVVVATEQPFNVVLSDGSYTSGRFDQIIRWAGKLWGRDFKTTSKEGAFFARTLDPNDQFTRYTFAESKLSGEQVQGQIVETLYNAKTKGPIITSYTSSRSLYQLNEWERNQVMINKVLQLYRDEDIWPMHEVNCPFCVFHSVCKLPSEAAMMAQLDAEFITRPWDNTKTDD